MKTTPRVENRRGFLKRSCCAAISTASAATLSSPAVPAQQHGASPSPAGVYLRMVKSNDAQVARMMATREGTERAGTARPFSPRDAVLESLRLGADFFRKGYFYSRGLQLENDNYLLHRRMEVPYYQPLPRKLRRADGDYPLTPAEDRFWSKMDFPSRPQSNIKFLEYSIRFSQKGEAIEIDIDVHGHDKIPVALELCFRRGGSLVGVNPSENSDEFFLEQGVGHYRVGEDAIEFGPGEGLHRWTGIEGASIGGTAPRAVGLRVYIAWLTPFRKTITIA